METLSNNWYTEGWIDFEYKQYILLAYLENVKKKFLQTRIYPSLSELVGHFNRLDSFKKGKQDISSGFHKRITGYNAEDKSWIYSSLEREDETIQELTAIVDFALPKLGDYILEGKEIFDFIYQNLSIHPVGIMPLYNREGYFLLKIEDSPELKAYRYTVTVFGNENDKYRSIETSLFYEFSNITFEKAKTELIRINKELPNPSTFAIESEYRFPVEDAILPVSRRKLIREIDSD